MNQSLPDTFLSGIPQGLHILSWKQNANLSIQFSFCYLHKLSSATAPQIFPDYLTLMPNAVSSFLRGWKHLHGRCYLTKPGKNHNVNGIKFILNKRTISSRIHVCDSSVSLTFAMSKWEFCEAIIKGVQPEQDCLLTAIWTWVWFIHSSICFILSTFPSFAA